MNYLNTHYLGSMTAEETAIVAQGFIDEVSALQKTGVSKEAALKQLLPGTPDEDKAPMSLAINTVYGTQSKTPVSLVLIAAAVAGVYFLLKA